MLGRDAMDGKKAGEGVGGEGAILGMVGREGHLHRPTQHLPLWSLTSSFHQSASYLPPIPMAIVYNLALLNPHSLTSTSCVWIIYSITSILFFVSFGTSIPLNSPLSLSINLFFSLLTSLSSLILWSMIIITLLHMLSTRWALPLPLDSPDTP